MLLVATFLVTTVMGFGSLTKSAYPLSDVSQIAGEDVEDISMVQLIANPKAYDGKTVRISGFLHLGGDERAIYLHNDDFLYGITQNSFSIEVTGKDVSRQKFNAINNQYVTCVARFVDGTHGSAGSNRGTLTNVTTLEFLGSHHGAPPPSTTPESAAAAQKRSYVVMDGDPSVPGPKGTSFIAGDKVAFNVFYKQVGPNPVELGGVLASIYLRADDEISTEEEVAHKFANEVAAKHQEWDARPVPVHHPTMSVGSSQYVTAIAQSAGSEPLHYTQQDIDDIDNGSKVLFVLLNVPYKDLGVEHQFHLCMFRQKNGVWHYCNVYNDVE